MQIEKGAVQDKKTYPFDGVEGYARGARNYDRIIRGNLDDIQIHLNSGELHKLPPGDVSTPDAYLDNIGSLMRQRQARAKRTRAKEDVMTVGRLRANLVGFGKAAWESGEVDLGFKAFETAHVLGDTEIHGILYDLLSNPNYKYPLKVKLARAIEATQRERQRTGEAMEDIRELLPFVREFVS